jgi:hypothetical protein
MECKSASDPQLADCTKFGLPFLSGKCLRDKLHVGRVPAERGQRDEALPPAEYRCPRTTYNVSAGLRTPSAPRFRT